MELSAHGIRIDLPDGWEGRIYRRPEGMPILHAANFPLPPEDGDFGAGAIRGMPSDGVFIALAEYLPDALGESLFAREGLPLPIRSSDLNSRALQRLGPGKAGLQRFFTTEERPFCLHLVVGSESVRSEVEEANHVLGTLRIATKTT